MSVDKNDTSSYAPSKAPETSEHAEEKKSQADTRLHPGGAHGTPMPTGMEGLDRDTVPNEAVRPEQMDSGTRIKP
jgi:hypothetical protein